MSVKWIVCLYIWVMGFFPVLALATACNSDKDYQYANHLREQEAYTDAVAVYESVLVRDPACMAAKIEMGFCHLNLGNYDQATAALNEARQATLQDNSNPDAANKVRKLIDAQLAQIPQMRNRSRPQDTAIAIQQGGRTTPANAQFSAGLGFSDNINGGVQFDELTFGQGDATITKTLTEQNKAHEGTWLDLEAAWQHYMQVSEGVDGKWQVMATWRDSHDNSDVVLNEGEFDLGTVRSVLELKPSGTPVPFDPRVVLSGGSFFLGGEEYRDDLAIGGRVSKEIAGRKVTLGYQFADHNYRTIDNTDGRYHRLSLSVPLLPATGSKNLMLGFDLGHQWPESTGRLGDYRETSGKLRLSFEPAPQSAVSASFGVSKQQDAAPYNRDFFGDAKRNVEQQVLDVGWSMEIDKDLTFEANIQHRKRDSAVKLFEHDATDLTVGLRWQLD